MHQRPSRAKSAGVLPLAWAPFPTTKSPRCEPCRGTTKCWKLTDFAVRMARMKPPSERRWPLSLPRQIRSLHQPMLPQQTRQDGTRRTNPFPELMRQRQVLRQRWLIEANFGLNTTQLEKQLNAGSRSRKPFFVQHAASPWASPMSVPSRSPALPVSWKPPSPTDFTEQPTEASMWMHNTLDSGLTPPTIHRSHFPTPPCC